MFGAVTDELALKPGVDGSVVEVDVIVGISLELVGIELLDGPLLPTCSDGPSLSQVDLNMDHPVGERLQLGIGVGGTIEDEIPRLQILLLESLVRQQVELVGLVPLSQRVAEVLFQVEDALADDGTAVQEEGSRVEGVSGLVVLLSVGDSGVLASCLQELGSELLFEVRAGSIDLFVLEVLVEFELVEFLLLELLEGVLDGLLGCMVPQQAVLLVCLIFHGSYRVVCIVYSIVLMASELMASISELMTIT